MKKKQKLLAIIIAISMLTVFTGCSDSSNTETSTSSTTDVEQSQELVEEETIEEETTEEETIEEEVIEEETIEEEVIEEEIIEEVIEEEIIEEETIEEETIEEEPTEEESVEETVVTGDFEQLALPSIGETVATIKVANFGEIKIKFFLDKAPLAVENFVTHAKNGYYDGIIFHRVINDFMIQGGDPTGSGRGGESIWGTKFVNEDDADLYHFNGALSMANAGKDTNGSQFFIVNSSPTSRITSSRSEYSDYAKKIYSNIGGTPFLDGDYTVFGQVYEGLDIVNSIMKVQTTGAEKSTPVENVVIESITILEYK